MGDPTGNGAPSTPIWEQPEFIEKMSQLTATITNQAIGARFKTFEKQLDAKSAESTKSILDKIAEMGTTAAAGKSGKKGEKGEEESSETPAFKSMQRQLAEVTKETERLKSERDQERSKSRDMSLRQKVTDELTKNGITDPQRARHALAVLKEEQRVKYAEDDSDDIVFRDADGSFLDLSTGVKSWSKGEDGKHFLPPTGARGSGDRPGQGSRNANQVPPSGEATATDIGLALLSQYGGTSVG